MERLIRQFIWVGIFLLFPLLISCAHIGRTSANRDYETPADPYHGEVLNFYETEDPYGEFSNFALFPVYVDGEWWKTSEHYYQAHKYDREDLIHWVQAAPAPMEAALRGRDKNIPKRADWDQRKDEFMEKAVMDKFTRHPRLKKLLLSTGKAHIHEHTKNDCYWGDCGNGTGKDKLGLLLEKVRANLNATGEHP